MKMFNINRRDFLKTCGAVIGAIVINTGLPIPGFATEGKSLKNYMDDRARGVYEADGKFGIRASQDNSQVQKLYKDWLGEPNGHKAHELLHMKFRDRSGNVKRLGDRAKNPRAGEFTGQPYPYE